MIRVPDSELASVQKFDTIVESVDIFPTLCELAGLAQPDFVQGESLAGILRGEPATEQTAVSYFKQARSLRTDRYRLIVHRDGHRELYDHDRQSGETENIALQSPELCDQFQQLLDERCPDTKH